MPRYVVVAERNGKKVYSQLYKTKAEAKAHVRNTEKNWKGMYNHPKIKEVK